ncbi:unnamed protein product [Paramecium sonneborni]|uniref:Uncharacterized protein n=1 Tax=Paramecium sonneborni TaxID=65129 RepID=A0A8S1PIF4_9CILI|nr:unnamed protein product [Paramecium sonneborni]
MGHFIKTQFPKFPDTNNPALIELGQNFRIQDTISNRNINTGPYVMEEILTIAMLRISKVYKSKYSYLFQTTNSYVREVNGTNDHLKQTHHCEKICVKFVLFIFFFILKTTSKNNIMPKKICKEDSQKAEKAEFTLTKICLQSSFLATQSNRGRLIYQYFYLTRQRSVQEKINMCIGKDKNSA